MSSKQQAIAELAYLLWESRGRPENSAERNWAEAEALLAVRDLPPSELPSGGELAVSDVLPGERRKTDRKPRVTTRREPKRPAGKGSPPVE
jgi:Protein of unknown function (DUF2934)